MNDPPFELAAPYSASKEEMKTIRRPQPPHVRMNKHQVKLGNK